MERPLHVELDGKSTANGSPRLDENSFDFFDWKAFFTGQNSQALKVSVPGGPEFESLVKDVHPTEGREWTRVERDEENDHSSADSNGLSHRLGVSFHIVSVDPSDR